MTNNNLEPEQQKTKPKRTRLFKQMGVALGIIATIAVVSVNGYLFYLTKIALLKSLILLMNPRRVYADHHVSTIEKNVDSGCRSKKYIFLPMQKHCRKFASSGLKCFVKRRTCFF